MWRGLPVVAGSFRQILLSEMGERRSYQLIATASKDKHVRIFKLSFDENDQQTPITKRRFQVELVAAFKDHQAEVIQHHTRSV